MDQVAWWHGEAQTCCRETQWVMVKGGMIVSMITNGSMVFRVNEWNWSCLLQGQKVFEKVRCMPSGRSRVKENSDKYKIKAHRDIKKGEG